MKELVLEFAKVVGPGLVLVIALNLALQLIEQRRRQRAARRRL